MHSVSYWESKHQSFVVVLYANWFIATVMKVQLQPNADAMCWYVFSKPFIMFLRESLFSEQKREQKYIFSVRSHLKAQVSIASTTRLYHGNSTMSSLLQLICSWRLEISWCSRCVTLVGNASETAKGDVESIASRDAKELTALFEQISGSDQLKQR